MAKHHYHAKDVIFIIIGALILLNAFGYVALDNKTLGIIIGALLIVKGAYSLVEKHN